jgi:hypothetical protein
LKYEESLNNFVTNYITSEYLFKNYKHKYLNIIEECTKIKEQIINLQNNDEK